MPITCAQLLQAVGGELVQGPPGAAFSSVTVDSRSARHGSVFFALKGERTDGHLFVNAACQQGARGAVVSRQPEPPVADMAVIRVPDTLAALGKLGAWWRSQFAPRCVAITGSSGKTTTKEMVEAILKSEGSVLAAPENYNTEIGVPLTLLALEGWHRYLVLELAMRGPGQIEQLGQMAVPEVGVITNAGAAHLGLLGSAKAVRAAKLELATTLAPNGRLVVCGDDDALLAAAASTGVPFTTFGMSASCDVRAERVVLLPPPAGQASPQIRFDVIANGERAECVLLLPGRHNVLNALAALASCQQLGISLSTAVAAVGRFSPPIMRAQVFTARCGFTVVNDAYNANPESLACAVEMVATWPGARRKAAALGDMGELGEASELHHRQLGKLLAAFGLDRVVFVGEWREVVRQAAEEGGMSPGCLTACATKEEATQALVEWAQPGDVILVKASRVAGMEEVADALCFA